MKDGYYWVRHRPLLDNWVMVELLNNKVYTVSAMGVSCLGSIDNIKENYPGIKFVEVDTPSGKEKLYKVDLNALTNNRQTTVTHPENALYVYIGESFKEQFLDGVAANARLRAESLMTEIVG